MVKKILIDALFPDDQRLIVCNDGIIEDFTHQVGQSSFTKGNIYIGRITYVTSALQAAFVDYGGKRHGFLPFSEIHPSYYQLSENEMNTISQLSKKNDKGDADKEKGDDLDPDVTEDRDSISKEKAEYKGLGSYKITDVIKKDQLILIQIRKEERGNKGASLTTYVSLIGRYWILVPMSYRNGGISRTITDETERGRLKLILQELKKVNRYNACTIVRSAASGKYKQEIKRDFQYLLKMWANIKKHTIKPTGPVFVYAEADIVKQTVRDFYTNDIAEILISGKEAYKEILNLAKIVIPEAVNKIKEYTGGLPIFASAGIEEQLNSLYNNMVPISSGGYLVINETEALVAIDVNSGRDTVEVNVEDTAVKNNLAAVTEIARQLKLRDLGGLIVIDFIDMSEEKNRKLVEDAMAQSLSADKASCNVGKIGEFGLMEMTRERVYSSILESTTSHCSACNGRGRVRFTSITTAVILRAIQKELSTIDKNSDLLISAGKNVILYLLNVYKIEILELEQKFKTKINLVIDEKAGFDGFFIETVQKNVNYSLQLDKEEENDEANTKEAHAEWNKNSEKSMLLAFDAKNIERSNNNGNNSNKGGGKNKRRKNFIIMTNDNLSSNNTSEKKSPNNVGNTSKKEVKEPLWKRVIKKLTSS